MSDAPVTLAAVIGAHGVAGEVRLKVFADDLSAFTSFNGGTLTLKSLRPGNNGAIARFAEVGNRTAAEALREPTSATMCFLKISALPRKAISGGGASMARRAAG